MILKYTVCVNAFLKIIFVGNKAYGELIPFRSSRESAGANTSGKYGFQVHWALCTIIDSLCSKKEYAVLVEHHEDVVIANSLEAKLLLNLSFIK